MAKVRVYKSEKWMRHQFFVLKLTEREIAEKAGCTLSTVYTYLKLFGLKG